MKQIIIQSAAVIFFHEKNQFGIYFNEDYLRDCWYNCCYNPDEDSFEVLFEKFLIKDSEIISDSIQDLFESMIDMISASEMLSDVFDLNLPHNSFKSNLIKGLQRHNEGNWLITFFKYFQENNIEISIEIKLKLIEILDIDVKHVLYNFANF